MGSKLRRAGTVTVSLAITTCCASVAAAEGADREHMRYAINLASTMKASDLTRLASHPAFARHRVYETRYEKDGVIWQRLRIGFFATHDEALGVARSLEEGFPDAWVTRVSDGEWQRFRPRDESKAEVVEASVAEPTAEAVAEPFVKPAPVAARTPLENQAAAPDPPIVVAEAPSVSAHDAQPSVAAPKSTEASASAAPELPPDPLDAARAALIDGEPARAIDIVRPVLTSDDPVRRADALELTGMATERAGDLDGAAAVYTRYLEAHPEGEGTGRVRQRLAALETAGDPPIPVLREGSTSDDTAWEVDSSLDQWYRHAADIAGPEGGRVTSSLLSNGLRLRARRSTEHTDTRMRVDGAWVADFDDRTSGQLLARELYVEFDERRFDLSARLGRQRHNRDGVLGRFDGGAFDYTINDTLKLNAVGGLPVVNVADGVDTDRYFYGLSLDIGPFGNGWDFNVYGIDQYVDGVTDRTAIGGEIRYADLDRSLYGLVDYDLSYKQLNTAMLIGSWAFADRVAVDLTLEQQLTPVLTTSNALIGQEAGSIDELLQTLPISQIRQLARDRTAMNRSVRVGGSYPLGERLRVRGDFSLSHLSSTEADEQVEGAEGTGTEYRYGAQLIGNALFQRSDLHILSLEYLQAKRGDVVSLGLDSAYPFDLAWFLKPRLLLGWRDGKDGDGDQITVGFAPRLDYMLRDHLRLHLEVGGEWASGTITGESEDAYGYFLEAGYRWDF